MIFCETAGRTEPDLDTLVVFVSQLRAAGVEAAVPVWCLRDFNQNRNRQFDILPLLTEAAPAEGDRLFITSVDSLSDSKLAALRSRYDLPVNCVAIGRLETYQSQLGIRAKLSYILDREPEILALGDKSIDLSTAAPVLGVNVPARHPSTADDPVRVLLYGLDLEDPVEATALKALVRDRKLSIAVMTSGKSKEVWLESYGTGVPVFHYGEALPVQISPRLDAIACFQNSPLGYRGNTLIANAVANGLPVLDASHSQVHLRASDVFIRSSSVLTHLRDHLIESVTPAMPQIRQESRGSAFARETSVETVLGKLNVLPGCDAVRNQPINLTHIAPDKPTALQKIVYVPTNGVGLGHAQRTSLIASGHDRRHIQPIFAAFPSCMKMLTNYGFDCAPLIGRSGRHRAPHANDLVNYTRLRALARDASAIVFDGGYIFDSVYRTILDHDLAAVWIRRGLWQASQNNTVPLDREKVFKRVIVPAEAFEELNQSYSDGAHVRHVGPIVQKARLEEDQRTALRDQLAGRYGGEFDRLVVTMLGGGVAANRSVQVQAVCGAIEARGDTLNLVVVWPTATVEAAAFSWRRSRVVRTHHASPLVCAADLFISAAGYNSFHESLYNQIPTIFLPQVSELLDDQVARATAAADRGVATMVEPQQLMSLEREISGHLDGERLDEIRSRLSELPLPMAGNQAALGIIEEVASCRLKSGMPSSDEYRSEGRKILTI